MNYRGEIEILLDELKMRLKKSNEELAACPEGQLHQIHRGKKLTYFQALHQIDGRQLRKVITHEPELIKKLVRKEYLKVEKKILEKDVHILEQLLARYVDPGADTVLHQLPDRFQGMPEDWYWYGSSEAQRQNALSAWAAAPFRQSTFKPEKKISGPPAASWFVPWVKWPVQNSFIIMM